ncbi:hypothetical protein [Sphingomonas mali]|uniref:hypothetical protein n=1 Tax=Sphingomonas mali TaxID=40682 RepID=UPI0008317226|nr:hypothetical protein [Sphingomonas mali]
MIKTMMTGFATAAALTMTAGSAQAAEPRMAGDAAPAARATPTAESTPQPKYCVVDTVTGSRIPQKVCKTREAWMREDGFDPLNR